MKDDPIGFSKVLKKLKIGVVASKDQNGNAIANAEDHGLHYQRLGIPVDRTTDTPNVRANAKLEEGNSRRTLQEEETVL